MQRLFRITLLQRHPLLGCMDLPPIACRQLPHLHMESTVLVCPA